jgi:hypothetical protein
MIKLSQILSVAAVVSLALSDAAFAHAHLKSSVSADNASVNRYGFAPRLSQHSSGSMKGLVAATTAAIVSGAVVIILVAWFGTLEPS